MIYILVFGTYTDSSAIVNLLFTVSWVLPLTIRFLNNCMSSSKLVTRLSTSSIFLLSLWWFLLLFIHEIEVAGITTDDNFWVRLKLLSRISVQQATIGSKNNFKMNNPQFLQLLLSANLARCAASLTAKAVEHPVTDNLWNFPHQCFQDRYHHLISWALLRDTSSWLSHPV